MHARKLKLNTETGRRFPRGLIAAIAVIGAAVIIGVLEYGFAPSLPGNASATNSAPAPLAQPMTPANPLPAANAEASSVVPAINAEEAIEDAGDDAEPDPYAVNEVEIPPGAEDGLMHSVPSDVKTGADLEAELSEKTGGAYIADNPYGPPPDNAPPPEPETSVEPGGTN